MITRRLLTAAISNFRPFPTSSLRNNSNLRPFSTSSLRNDEDIPLNRQSESAAYDASGKTEINLLNETTEMMMIDTYSQVGFRVNQKTFVAGPMAIFPNAILSWKVKYPTDIDERALSLFTVVEPKPDLVVVGYGDRLPTVGKRKANYEVLTIEEEQEQEKIDQIRSFNLQYTKRVNKHFAKMSLLMKTKGINVIFQPTQDAIATYNYLLQEQRLVAGALIPPFHINAQDPDIKLSYELGVRGDAAFGLKTHLLGKEKPLQKTGIEEL